MDLLENLEDWGSVPGLFQFCKLLQLLNNQLCQDSSVSFFLKLNKEQLKMVNVNCYFKYGQILPYYHFNKIMRAWN